MVSWSEITAVARLIYDQAKTARVNMKQTKRLVERIRLLIESVLRAQNIADNQAFIAQHQAFKETLDDALKLVNDLQSENWFYRFGKAGSWKCAAGAQH